MRDTLTTAFFICAVSPTFAADQSKKYICEQEIGRAYLRENGSWQDLGPQENKGILLRALRSSERAPGTTWGVFSPGADNTPQLRCRESHVVLDCGYPGHSISINLESGRYVSALFSITKTENVMAMSGGSCREMPNTNTVR